MNEPPVLCNPNGISFESENVKDIKGPQGFFASLCVR